MLLYQYKVPAEASKEGCATWLAGFTGLKS